MKRIKWDVWSRLVIVCVPVLFKNALPGQTSGSHNFDDNRLHEIRFYFEESDYWKILSENYEQHVATRGGDGDIPYLQARMVADSAVVESVGGRLKGLSSYAAAGTVKKPIKVDINEFVDQTFDGLKKFNLHNGVGDPSLQREMLSYRLLRQMGVAAPRTAYAKVFFNNVYWGLYIIVEQVDKTFLKNNFIDEDGNLFKNESPSRLKWLGPDKENYRPFFELETNENQADWSGFIRFLDILNNASDSTFAAEIESVFSVETFLKTLVVDIATNNWDSYLQSGRNFYLYQHPYDGKFYWIPWDYNLSWGGNFYHEGHPLPPVDPDCPLKTKFGWNVHPDTVHFTDLSAPVAEKWYWDFGDGTTDTVKNPIHIYAKPGKYKVCLTAERRENGQVCHRQRCETVNTGYDPNQCKSAISGPYAASDFAFVQTVDLEPVCCSNWSVLCERIYQNIHTEARNLSIGITYPWINTHPDYVLISRLMSVPKFKEQFLSYACELMQYFFNEEKLVSFIQNKTNQIRESVISDENYFFTADYFDYNTGGGSGGGHGAIIPPLQYFLKKRITSLQQNLRSLTSGCPASPLPIEKGTVVINELMASNPEGSGIMDTDGEHEDWIELYNNSDSPVLLDGFYLTNDLAFPRRWAFPPGTVVPPGGYSIIWADQDLHQSGTHAAFKLPATGGALYLTFADGTVLDEVVYGEQSAGSSAARVPNGTGDFRNQPPTFQRSNEVATAVPSMSLPEIEVHIYPNPAREAVYFQLNSRPTSAVKYEILTTDGIRVSAGNIFPGQAVAVSLSRLPSGWYWVRFQQAGAQLTHRLWIQH